MKKNIRKYLSCVALLLVFVMMFSVLSGCKKNDTDPKETESGTESESSTTEKTPEFPEACEDHRGDFICVNCGRRLTPNGFFMDAKSTDATYTVVLDDVDVTVPVGGNVVNVKITGGELSLRADNEKLNGYGHVVGTMNLGGKITDIDQTVSVKDSVVYVKMTSTMATSETETGTEEVGVYLPLDSITTLMGSQLPSGSDAMVGSIMEKLPDLLEKEVLPMMQAFLTAHPELEDICARVADLLWTVKKTESGYEIALSMDKIAALNDKFETMKVSELVDLILGEGTFAGLETYANGIFDKTVSGLLADLKTQGIDVLRILKMVDSLMPKDEKGNTPLTDVLTKLNDSATQAKTLQDLMLEDKPEGVTDAEYLAGMKQQISAVFASLKELTVWDAIEDSLGGNGEVGGPLAAEEAPAASLHDTVAEVLKLVKDGVKITVNTDVFGNLIGAKLELNLPDLIGKGNITVTNSYTSTVDYDKVVNEVSADVKKVNDSAEKLAAALEAKLKADDAANSLTYDAATGIATVKVNITAHYLSGEVTLNGKTGGVWVNETNAVTLKVNLKKLMALMTSSGKFDGVFYLEDLQNNLTWTATVEYDDGTSGPADAATLEKLEQDGRIENDSEVEMMAMGIVFSFGEDGSVTVSSWYKD